MSCYGLGSVVRVKEHMIEFGFIKVVNQSNSILAYLMWEVLILTNKVLIW